MFLSRLASTLSITRQFSTSVIAQYPKLKSHSGAKKRWRSLPSGVFKRAHACRYHLNEHKTAARKNRLSQTTYSHGKQTPTLKKLLPYGSW